MQGRQKCVHQSQEYLKPVPMNLRWLLKRLKDTKPGTDQIPAELIKAGGRTTSYKIYNLINSIRNKDKLPEEGKKSTTVSIYNKKDKTRIM